jgi:Carboxypeptidase regulatory-like domain
MLSTTRQKEAVRLRCAILGAVSALFLACATDVHAQKPTGVIRGEVTDSSGGRLPGVTVIATTADGRIPATTTTDATGGYAFRAVPAGPVMLRFRREGFAGVLVGVTVEAGGESRVVQRMELAPLTETVVVEAPAPAAPPPPPLPPPPAPAVPRGPLLKAVPPHDRDSVCGPAKPSAAAEPLGTIRSNRDVAEGGLYTVGRQIKIDGGTLNGLEVGQNLVVRRSFRVQRLAGTGTRGEHTAGLVQVVSASDRSSVAVVIYACDALKNGDVLVAFTPESVRPVEARGVPDYNDAARILFADEAQTLAAPRRLMVIDRGTALGIRVGQRLTLFRRRGGGGPEVTGEAIVVAVRTDSATIRIEHVTDAVMSGDLAAPQIPAPGPGR